MSVIEHYILSKWIFITFNKICSPGSMYRKFKTLYKLVIDFLDLTELLQNTI